MASSTVLPSQIDSFRTFNRFYTQSVGSIGPYLGSSLSLTEVRVLYEIARVEGARTTASVLATRLGIDNGYLSRILKDFDKNGWIVKEPNPNDGRQSLISLSEKGTEAYLPLKKLAEENARAQLEPLSEEERKKVVDSMESIERLLNPQTRQQNGGGAAPAPAKKEVILRGIQPGDLGWVVQEHGELYAREYGWNVEFEALVAEIVAGIGREKDQEFNRGWIATLEDGTRVGSIFVVKTSETTAKLRLLAVSEKARGLGLGKRLSEVAIQFCREKKYEKVELWTHSVLVAARGIYKKLGFKLVKEEAYFAFGKDAVSENWELVL